MIPKSSREWTRSSHIWLLDRERSEPLTMFIIECLHPDGWRQKGRTAQEYWAYQEAQVRSCSDGRTYRIIDATSHLVVAMVSGCQSKKKQASGALLLT